MKKNESDGVAMAIALICKLLDSRRVVLCSEVIKGLETFALQQVKLNGESEAFRFLMKLSQLISALDHTEDMPPPPPKTKKAKIRVLKK